MIEVNYEWTSDWFGRCILYETATEDGINLGTIMRKFPNWKSCQMYLAKQATDAANSELAGIFKGHK